MSGWVEQWRPVPGFPGYEVSDLGRARSWKAFRGLPVPRQLTVSRMNNGYTKISLYGPSGSQHTIPTHRAVGEAFLGALPDGMQTRHLDGDRTNNTLTNLCYGTPAENMADQLAHGNHHEARKTHCVKGHPFDMANTRHQPNGSRRCRTCHREHEAEYARRRRDAA